jgi:hypothetical protein
MRRRKRIDPIEQIINSLEEFHENVKTLMVKTSNSLNSATNILNKYVNPILAESTNNINLAKENLKQVKESKLLNSILKNKIIDAKDLSLV